MKDDDLNGKTPQWFKDWHYKHFQKVKERTFSNQKLIYFILAAIIAAALVSNGNINILGKIARACVGG